jgi:ATP-dependent DNA helicase RecQ
MNIAQMLIDAESSLQELKPGAELRDRQRQVLQGLAKGENIFASLPTGYGKSLCYWLPAAAWSWRVWVISPLISLMEDQVAACEAMGIKALAIHSGNIESSLTDLRAGKWQVLFLSPERLAIWGERGELTMLEENNLSPELLVLDEMHCFEEWRRFREGYQAVFDPIRKMIAGGSQLLGLSASFSIAQSDLWMREFCDCYSRVESSLARDNLSLLLVPIEEEYWRWLLLTAFLRDLISPESALIYCSSQKECDYLSSWLVSAGFPAVAYHAGLPKEIRRERSKAFRVGLLRIVCATSAFGMGIDYPHVGRVLHFSLPYDLSAYWQEVGRAGRNGAEAFGIVFWRRSEISRLRRLDEEQAGRYSAMWRAWIEGGCRKVAVAKWLGATEDCCGKCDRCRSGNNYFFPSWLESWPQLLSKKPWWLDHAAQPEAWLSKKILQYGKALDHPRESC